MTKLVMRLPLLMALAIGFLLYATGPGEAWEPEPAHAISKKSWALMGCNGQYEHTNFGRLSLICEQCYHLTHDLAIRARCRVGCFHNQHFLACREALLEEEQHALKWREVLSGKAGTA